MTNVPNKPSTNDRRAIASTGNWSISTMPRFSLDNVLPTGNHNLACISTARLNSSVSCNRVITILGS